MVSTLSVPLSLFPDEASIIGALVVGYGEIEFDLGFCVDVVLSDQDDLSHGFKVFYRLRGEDARINLADSLCRPFFAKAGLDHEFAWAIDAVRYCKTIRNQYAHSNWVTGTTFSDGPDQFTWSKDGLRLSLLEEAAAKSGPMNFEMKKITVPLLNEQDAYFRNVRDWLIYLRVAYKAGGASSGRGLKPQRIEKPRRYIDLE